MTKSIKINPPISPIANNNKILSIDDEGFEKLLLEIYSGCQEDIDEANDNMGLYRPLLDGGTGKDQYGEHYNEAMKIKGEARDRLLKLAGLMSQRVRTKEFMNKGADPNATYSFSPQGMLEIMEKFDIGKAKAQEDEDDD
jgi:hypothetical protein